MSLRGVRWSGRHLEQVSNGSRMKNKGVGLVLFVYSILLGLGMLLNRADKTLIIFGAGGALLSALYGWTWLVGRGRKVWPILTLVVVGFMLLSRAVHSWFEVGAEGIRTPILLTALLALTVGTIMRVAYSGMFSYANSREGESVKNPHQEKARNRA